MSGWAELMYWGALVALIISGCYWWKHRSESEAMRVAERVKREVEERLQNEQKALENVVKPLDNVIQYITAGSGDISADSELTLDEVVEVLELVTQSCNNKFGVELSLATIVRDRAAHYSTIGGDKMKKVNALKQVLRQIESRKLVQQLPPDLQMQREDFQRLERALQQVDSATIRTCIQRLKNPGSTSTANSAKSGDSGSTKKFFKVTLGFIPRLIGGFITSLIGVFKAN